MNETLLLAMDPSWLLLRRGNGYLLRRDGVCRPLDVPADAETFLKACVAKWGYHRVLDASGKPGVQIPVGNRPSIDLYRLRDGEEVFCLRGQAAPGATLVRRGAR